MRWIRSHWKAALATAAAFGIGAAVVAGGAEQRDEVDRKDLRRSAVQREQAASSSAERNREREQAEPERRRLQAERRVARSTIEGDGTWQVGRELAAGTYRADAGEGCHWARLTTAHAGDALDNVIEDGIGGGSQRVTLGEGEWFETADCGEWRKVG